MARTKKRASERQLETEVEDLATERLEAVFKVINFEPVRGAPAWVTEMLMPDLQPLFSKDPKFWTEQEIRQAQESVDSLLLRFMALCVIKYPEGQPS